MWLFFSLVSLLLLIAVAWLLLRYPLWSVPFSVRAVVSYSWLTSVSIVSYIPVDVWATIQGKDVYPIYVMWEISFWSTQILTWLIIPLFMGYVDSGRFSIPGKMLNSLRDNLFFYAILLLLSFIGLTFVTLAGSLSLEALPGTCIALTNMFGLVVVVFLMGYGLVWIPRSIWRLSDPEIQLEQLQCDLEKTTDRVQACIADMERINLVVHASAQQISRRDAIHPYLEIVWNEFLKSQAAGLDLETTRNLNDHLKLLTTEELDYALDLKGLVELRRRVRNASNRFEASKVEYIHTIRHAVFLSEVCRRRRNRDYTDASDHWSFLKTVGWYVVCVLSPILRKLLAVFLSLMSLIVVWCELVIIGEKQDLSPVYLMVDNAKTEWAIYWVVLLPFVYMFFCTYHTLFNLAAFKFYHLLPKASSSYSLLLNSTLMCRFAPSLAYNFLHVIQVIQNEEDQRTAFSRVMGSMRVLPFFGNAFNSVLPIFLLVHCILIWMDAWKRLGAYFIPEKFQFNEEEADEEHSAKGRLVLMREIEAQQQGKEIGEVLGLIRKPQSSTRQGSSEERTLSAPLSPGDQSSGPSKTSSLDNFFSSITGSSSKKQNPSLQGSSRSRQ